MQAYQYVQFATMLCSVMLSAIFFAAWYSFGRRPHALAWSAAFLVGALQWYWNCFLQGLPDKISYWIIVTSFSALVLNLALWGFMSRAGWRNRASQMIMIAIAVELVILWFTLGAPHVGLQTAIPVFYSVVLLLAIAVVLIRGRPRPYPAEWGMAGISALFACSQAVAGVAALLQGADFQQRYLDIYNAVNFLALPSAYIGMGLFAMFILATDLSENMKNLAMTDYLTGCLNRRGFFDSSGRLVNYARRKNLSMTLVLCDLDHFKQVNDSHGHSTGDHVLKMAATVLNGNLRGHDIVGRLGGEEFAILLVDCSVEDAQHIATRIRHSIASASVVAGAHAINVTASLGVAPVNAPDYSVENALKQADQALYGAKSGGRDRVVVTA